MLILKCQAFSDSELLEYAASLSENPGDLKDKLLHWEFGPLLTMKLEESPSNYLFSDEKVPLHWDGAFYKEPRFLLFYCTESEGSGGETIFSDTEKIWDDLTVSEKEICSRVYLTYRTKKMAHYGGEIRVPLVQEHPKTGRKILRMAEEVETSLNPVELEIEGAPDAEEFYRFLTTKLYLPEYLYQHSWEAGDLIVSDNFTYLHGRNALGGNRKRTFKRIQIM